MSVTLVLMKGPSDTVRDIVSVSKLLQTFWRSLLPPCPESQQSKKGLLMTYIDVLFSDMCLKFSMCACHSICSCFDYNHPHTPANERNLHNISNTNVMLQEL